MSEPCVMYAEVVSRHFLYLLPVLVTFTFAVPLKVGQSADLDRTASAFVLNLLQFNDTFVTSGRFARVAVGHLVVDTGIALGVDHLAFA